MHNSSTVIKALAKKQTPTIGETGASYPRGRGHVGKLDQSTFS